MESRREHPDDDLSVMTRIGRGDRLALQVLYEKHFTSIKSYLVSLNGHKLSHEDLAQEVFLRAWKHAGRFRGDSSVETFLLGIARNVHREAMAEQSRKNRSLNSNDSHRLISPLSNAFGESLTEPEAALHHQEMQVILAQSLASLPPQYSQVVDLLIVQGLSSHQAAKHADCSPSNLRKRLHRALILLRDQRNPENQIE